MELRDKRILILSPQSWGTMFLSKHHYAVELAKRGNDVFFLNPPDQSPFSIGSNISLKESGTPRLYRIDHKLFFPYWMKFKFQSAFHFFMKFQVNKILKKVGDIDIVWSFDLGHLYPFHFFKNTYKIFYPVDEPLNQDAISSAEGADIIFSVTSEILKKYDHINTPKYLIGHGVTEEFLMAGDNTVYSQSKPVKVGLSGNLLRPDIDREILLGIINQNKETEFHFWGSYQASQSNIGGEENRETVKFIKALQGCANVSLHGVVSPKTLAEAISKMDMFLICYDVQKDQSKGTNYHKVMEYLATGRVIVSNNISMYKDRPNLVQMIDERHSNKQLPKLFREIIGNLSSYNDHSKIDERIFFANENLYNRQVERIENLITQNEH
ncbi:MAG: hypothetical protein JSS93_08155 [Bacteroidetes bacterium]|nr:hypothetical protein [Bacteroidota bacterium]